MKRRDWAPMLLLAGATLLVLLIAFGQIFVSGADKNRLFHPATYGLIYEMAVFFVVCMGTLKGIKRTSLRLGLLVLTVSVFAWLHQAFLPLVVSGLYILLILAVGASLRRRLDRKRRFLEYHIFTAMTDFMLGCGLMISLFCLMSLVGVGGIFYTRAASAFLALVLLAREYVPIGRTAKRSEEIMRKRRIRQKLTSMHFPKYRTVDWTMAVFLALTITMLFLQAGRMNICADYDSLHYGLRSEYILNNGTGIYENLGNVNVVYTYSKGLEILLFPISGLPSYGFFLSFQLWMTAGILAVGGLLARMFVGQRYGLLCMALLSCIPGITNMGITAKTDSATAMFQLFLIVFLLLFIRKRRNFYLTLAADAFMMTMILKPTALVFSTVLAGCAGLYLLASRRLKFGWKESFLLSAIPMAASWGLVWLRTFLLTGLPVTSVFYSIWSRLGFTVHYPFRFDDLPSNGGALFSRSGLKHLLKRLYGVLVAPVGADMAHVDIAWGTPLILIFLTLFVLWFFMERKPFARTEKAQLTCLAAMFLGTGAVSLIALYLLWQVDGNYFILLYCLITILAVTAIGKIKRRQLALAVTKVLVPTVIFNMMFTAVSNWQGALGLTPIRMAHKGYYDHRAEARETMENYGNSEIWKILEADPTTRVLVFGEQPALLLFPCNAQSYTDIEGSGGNYYISASVENMAEFLTYAQMDYVYAGSSYLKPGTDGWRNFTGLLTSGYLTELHYENGNLLARFTKEPAAPADPDALLSEFAQRYWPGDQR